MPRTFKVKLVGVTKNNNDGSARQAYIRKFARRGMPVMLRPEPSNPYDKHAIGTWITATVFWIFREAVQLGYLDSRLADEISNHLKRGGTATARIVDITGGAEGMEAYGVVIEITKSD